MNLWWSLPTSTHTSNMLDFSLFSMILINLRSIGEVFSRIFLNTKGIPKDTLSFSSYYIKDTYYYHDLSLFISALITCVIWCLSVPLCKVTLSTLFSTLYSLERSHSVHPYLRSRELYYTSFREESYTNCLEFFRQYFVYFPTYLHTYSFI